MTVPTLLLEGRPIRLGKRIGKGGEGEVYAVEGRADQALKVYTIGDTGDRAAKVEAMVRAGLAGASKLVSYPSAVVTDSKGRFAGFLMRLVHGHQPIHHLYAPGDRKANFPTADYRFLVHTARNVASALADVHARRCVIGDINHSGILVSDQAMVALIDADSFQVTEGAREFLCTVGVPEYTPPELQGRSLAGLRRTQNHDAFGLAVIVFQLLCMGRHPFVGTYAHGEMPMERAIAEHRFAYSRRRSVGMRPPPGTVRLKDFPPQIAGAFEAAFDPAAGRPTAAQWVALLEELENQLRRCSANELHYYPPGESDCPWCRMEKAVPGLALFMSPLPLGTTKNASPAGGFSLQAAWAAIEAVRLPSVDAPNPVLPPMDLSPSQAALAAASKSRGQRIWNAVLVVIGIAGLAAAPGAWFVWLGLGGYNVYRLLGPASAGGPIRKGSALAKARWNAALADWERRCGGPELRANRKKLGEAKQELEQLPSELQKRLTSYEANRRDFQLRTHLENHRIGAAKIKGIGPGRTAALASWGIESALQISYSRVMAIDGFGPAKAAALIAWRNMVEARFVFEPRPNAADAREKDRINRDAAQRGDQLRTMLARGAHDLHVASLTVQARWKSVDQALVRVHRENVQAQVDDAFVNASLGERVMRASPLASAIGIFVLLGAMIVMANLPKMLIAPAPPSAAPVVSQRETEKFETPRIYRVTSRTGTTVVNVRGAAGSDAAIVDKLNAGTEVRVIGRSKAPNGGSWLVYVRGDGSLGYVFEALLTPIPTKAGTGKTCGTGPWIDRTLCGDASLKALDAQLTEAYRAARGSASTDGKAQILEAQRTWLGRRDVCEGQPDPANCLAEAYRSRIAELSSGAVSVLPSPVPTAPAVDSPDAEQVPRVFLPPRLKGDASSLVTADDYPPSALSSGEAGRVVVQLHISPDGRVDDCRVSLSSGFVDLDAMTCRLLIRRARYSPGQDASGNPVGATATQSVVWNIPSN
ncbi:TonB family protein [Sphingomonas echinoides]|uniref:TonB family protein n=1 Tax=Sphingomonas echinoides TaxID=59803 RepID=A0ABU4PGA7_9SPHN|nr:TonB family protein [Sphingomonas echinoides]MDX5983231.1 TonB family protein [Sphingomonas echinoides]